jgi:hypothetical protein
LGEGEDILPNISTVEKRFITIRNYPSGCNYIEAEVNKGGVVSLP